MRLKEQKKKKQKWGSQQLSSGYIVTVASVDNECLDDVNE